MLFTLKVFQGREQGLGAEGLNLGIGQGSGLDVFGAVHKIVLQGTVAGALVFLGIGPAAKYVSLHFGENSLIGKDISKLILKCFQSFFKILSQAAHSQVGGVAAHADPGAAGQSVQTQGIFIGAVLVRPQVGEIVGSHPQERIVVGAAVVTESEGGDVVLLVLLVQEFQALELGDGHILFIIHKHRGDRSGFRGGDGGQESALLVAVGGDGRNLGSVYLFDALILSQMLENQGISVLREVFVGPGHDILLGDGGDTVCPAHFPFPGGSVDEAVQEQPHTGPIGSKGTHPAQFVIGFHGLQEFFGEVSVAEPGHLGQHQVAHLFQGLTLFGIALGQEESPVGTVVIEESAAQDLLVADQVHIGQAGFSVIQDAAHNLGDFALGIALAGGAPAEHHELGIVAIDIFHLGGGDGVLGGDAALGEIGVGLPLAEVFLDGLYHLVRVEISGQADGHVIGHVVRVFLVTDGLQGRILEVILRADDCLRPIRMADKEHAVQGVDGLFTVVGQAHILFLIHGLQFRMETAENAVHEAVGLDFGPVFHLVGRNFLHVTGDVVGGEGVGALGADDGHQLVVFVGDGNLGSLQAHGVNLLVHGFPLCRVRQAAIHLIQGVNLGQQRFFGLIILGAELLGSLEHHVLQVVGQAGVVGRIVLSSSMHGDVGLDTGLVLVHGHIDLQPVVQGVNLCLQRISLHSVIPRASGKGQCSQSDQKKKTFHTYS